MLKRSEIFPIGSMVTVQFEKGEDTVLVVVGHLTLQKNAISRYDYTCVEFPMGVEMGLVYINHEDIVMVVYHASDYGDLHENWMMRKYAEYKAYYRHFAPETRPDISVVRTAIHEAEHILPKRRRIKIIMSSAILMAEIAGATSLTILTRDWRVGVCALFFIISSIIYKKVI